jgi:Uma2 family endonuclease
MATSSVQPPKTYEDYLNTPDDGQRYELIDGEIVVRAAPTINHQRLVGRLVRLLGEIADSIEGDEAFLGPVAVSLDPANTLEPDVVYRKRESASVVEARRIRGVPELVIEVISPGSTSRDQVRKRAVYEAAGVPEYWIVDPSRKTVLALRLRDGRYHEMTPDGSRFASAILPAFTVDLTTLFKHAAR